MKTKDFSIGYVQNVHSIEAITTSFYRGKSTVKDIAINVSSNNHKNASLYLTRKQGLSLANKLQKIFKTKIHVR